MSSRAWMLTLVTVAAAVAFYVWVMPQEPRVDNGNPSLSAPSPQMLQSTPSPAPPPRSESGTAVDAAAGRELIDAARELLEAEPGSGPIDLGEKGTMYRVGSKHRPVIVGVLDGDGHVGLREYSGDLDARAEGTEFQNQRGGKAGQLD